MDLEELLNQLADQYLDSEEDNSEEIIQVLADIHTAVKEDAALLADFKHDVPLICGGIYIPYLLWDEVYAFLSGDTSRRKYIFELIEAFSKSEFDEKTKSRMKPLLIVYFSIEKVFELDKLRAFILDRAHKSVQQYFHSVVSFCEKNKESVKTFHEKLKMLHSYPPNFEYLRMPIARLHETLHA